MSIFDTFTDDDLLSDKVTHIYLYDEIDSKTIIKLQDEIQYACNDKHINNVMQAPKPILLHINSPGGSLYDGLKAITIFLECSVPIAIIVDGIATEVSTLISILAPYRICTKFSACMIGEYSVDRIGRKSYVMMQNKLNKFIANNIKKLYLEKTRMTTKQITKYRKHDLMIDYKKGMKLGIYDRCIDIKQKNKDISNVKYNCYQDNCIYIKNDIDSIVHKLDNIAIKENLKPIIFKIVLDKMMFYEMYSKMFALYTKISTIHAPTIGIIESYENMKHILPLLACDKIIMLNTATIHMHFLYDHDHAVMVSDAYKNTNMFLNHVKYLLKKHTKMPKDLIINLEKKRMVLDAETCLKYGIVNEIVSII